MPTRRSRARPPRRLRRQRLSVSIRSRGRPPASPAPVSFLRQLGSFIKAVFAGVVALAAAVSAIAAALYIVAPQLGPREKLGAEIDRIAIAQGVDYVEYTVAEQENGAPLDDAPRIPDRPNPTELGIVVLVHAKLSGFEDRSYSVRISAFDAATHKTFPSPPVDGKVVGSCDDQSPEADEDGIVWRCWLISPPRDAKYFVRVELMDYGPTKELRAGPIASMELIDFRDSETLVSLGPEHPLTQPGLEEPNALLGLSAFPSTKSEG